MSYSITSLTSFFKPAVSIIVLLAFFAPASAVFAEDISLHPYGDCTRILLLDEEGRVYEVFQCDGPVGNPQPEVPECNDEPNGDALCALPPTTPEKKEEPQVQQPSSSSSEEHKSESIQSSSKKGQVKGTIKVNKNKKVNIEKYINVLHRIVFGRNPSASEHAYWMSRVKDKPTLAQMLGAMQFHKLHNISH